MYLLRLSLDWRLFSHDEVSVLEALEGVPNLQEVVNKAARLGDSLEREVEGLLQCLDIVMVDVCAMQQRVIACICITFTFDVYCCSMAGSVCERKMVSPTSYKYGRSNNPSGPGVICNWRTAYFLFGQILRRKPGHSRI
jgi:hypothetical protein